MLKRCVIRALNLTTPFEKLFDISIDLSRLRVIGSMTYFHISIEQLTKLQVKYFRVVLLGYDEQSQAYRCWDPHNKRIVVSAYVIVFESIIGDFWLDQSFVDIFSYLLDDDPRFLLRHR